MPQCSAVHVIEQFEKMLRYVWKCLEIHRKIVEKLLNIPSKFHRKFIEKSTTHRKFIENSSKIPSQIPS